MPSMLRISKKTERIAFNILGKPSNMKRSTKRISKRNKHILKNDTRLVK